MSSAEEAAAAARHAIGAAGAGELPLVPPGRQIAPGLVPSAIIKGCWQLAGGHKGERASDRTGGQAAVEDFAKFARAGISTFDTADIYGPSESFIGQFLRAGGGGAGGAATPARVLTKHCVFSPADLRRPSREAVRRGVLASCRNLGLPSLDLVQFYWHDYGQPNFVQEALFLQELQEEGVIKHIGVTNFDVPRIRAMLDAGVKVVSSQVQFSLLDRRAENGHLAFCQANGIAVLPFGVVGGSFLTDRYVGMPYEEAQKTVKIDTYSKSKYLSVIEKTGGWSFLQSLLAVLDSIAKRHRTSVANVATKWVLGRPAVAAVIVGARNASHVDDHRRLFAFELDGEDLRRIGDVVAAAPRPTGDIYTWERGGAF